MRNKIMIPLLSTFCCAVSFAETEPSAQTQFEKVKNTATQSVTEAQASQKKVNALTSESSQIIGKYQQVLQQIEDTQIYNQKMKEMIQSQAEEAQAVENDIENIKKISTQVTPLTAKMLEALKQLVKRDLPFLKQEREQRVSKLEKMMSQSSVSLSEKYRKVLEAFQVEMGYGNSLNTYRAGLSQGDQNFTVDYLNLGRLGFYYLSLDKNKAGIWDSASNSWKDLSRSERAQVKTAMAMAQKKVAPQITPLPLIYKAVGGVK